MQQDSRVHLRKMGEKMSLAMMSDAGGCLWCKQITDCRRYIGSLLSNGLGKGKHSFIYTIWNIILYLSQYVFWDKVSLWRPRWSWTCYVAGLKCMVILMFYLPDPRIIGMSHHTHLVPTFLFSNFFNVTSPQNIFLAMKRNGVLTYMTTYIGLENSNTSN